MIGGILYEVMERHDGRAEQMEGKEERGGTGGNKCDRLGFCGREDGRRPWGLAGALKEGGGRTGRKKCARAHLHITGARVRGVVMHSLGDATVILMKKNCKD